MRKENSFVHLEALPPDLRDLALLRQNSGAGADEPPRFDSGLWVDARVASLRGPIPRPGASSVAVEKNRTFHVLIKPDNLTC